MTEPLSSIPKFQKSVDINTDLSKLILAVKGIVSRHDALPADYSTSPPRRGSILLDAIAKICAHHPECDRAAVALVTTEGHNTLYIATEPHPSARLYKDVEWLLENPDDEHADGAQVVATFISRAYTFIECKLDALSKTLLNHQDFFRALEEHNHDDSTATSSDEDSSDEESSEEESSDEEAADAPEGDSSQKPIHECTVTKELRNRIMDLLSCLSGIYPEDVDGTEEADETDEVYETDELDEPDEAYESYEVYETDEFDCGGVHRACLAVLKHINLANQQCKLWSLCDIPEILTDICSFAECVQMVARGRARLAQHPLTIVWAAQETLPCAVDLDEPSLKGWLSGFDFHAKQGNRDAVDSIFERIRDPHTKSLKDPNYAHAEGALIRSLLDNDASDPVDLYIGTSDDTCYACYEYLNAVNLTHGTSFKVRACSGCVHPTAFPEMDENVAKVLQKNLKEKLVTKFAEKARNYSLNGRGHDMYARTLKTDPEFARFVEEEQRKRKAGK